MQLKVKQARKNHCETRPPSILYIPGGRAVNPAFTRACKATVNPDNYPTNDETRPSYRPLSGTESVRKCVSTAVEL